MQITGLLRDMMPHDLIAEPPTGQNSYGVKTYGTPRTVKARINGKIQNVMGEDGQEHVSVMHATCDGFYGFHVRYRFTVPEEFSTNPDATDPVEALAARQPTAISVVNSSDEDGVHHQTVYF